MAGKVSPLLVIGAGALVVAMGMGKGKKKNGKKVVSTGKVIPRLTGEPYEWKIEKSGEEFVGSTRLKVRGVTPDWKEQARGESEEGVRRALIEFIDEQPGFEGSATEAAETENIVHSGEEDFGKKVQWQVIRMEDDSGAIVFVGAIKKPGMDFEVVAEGADAESVRLNTKYAAAEAAGATK